MKKSVAISSFSSNRSSSFSKTSRGKNLTIGEDHFSSKVFPSFVYFIQAKPLAPNSWANLVSSSSSFLEKWAGAESPLTIPPFSIALRKT